MMIEPTARQKFILTLVIHEYIKTAQPLASQQLVSRYNLDLSSATVRNELAALTEMGFLRQPHTSAGRVPTEEGYRFFVERLIEQTDLPATTQRMITHQFYQTRPDADQWLRLAASVLAHQSRGASLVTAPLPETARLKHLELIATRGRQVLMVLVLLGGEIRQQMFNLPEPVTQEQLSLAANHINHLGQGMDASGLAGLADQLSPLEKEVTALILADLSQASSMITGDVYMDGLTNVLAEPEFSTSEDARKALRLLEQRSLLEDLLSRTVLANNGVGVQVLIGGEGTWNDLSQVSLVLARYGVPGMATGTLGVLGPMRMPYGRAISTVRFVAGLLSDFITETLVD